MSVARLDGRFRDRRDAGRQLAARLEPYRERPGVVVLGLLRGGVVVAAEVARELALPLDVMICRKIGAPENPELAIGAVAEGGGVYLNQEGLEATGASPSYVKSAIDRQQAEIARRQKVFRDGKPLFLPPESTILIVDDGIATGATVMAAIRALRRNGVARIVAAVPVAPADTVELLRPLVEQVIVLWAPTSFWAVGGFYDDFTQVSDEEVCDVLAKTAMGRRRLVPES